jgi:PPOX class probable F420-dependent enzyme
MGNYKWSEPSSGPSRPAARLRKAQTIAAIRRMIVAGYSNFEIMEQLSISERTLYRRLAEAIDSDWQRLKEKASIPKLFEEKNFAFLAALMKDGSPQVTPRWVDIDKNNNTILVNTAKGRIKYRNISRDLRVAVSVIDFPNPYHMVTVRGKVIEQINGKEADGHIDKLAKKYLGKDKYPRRAPGEERYC